MNIFGEIDDRAITRAQWGIVAISGMGFFTDAYDLFVIGVAIKLITREWQLGALDVAVLSATALVSAALGSAIFGRVADVFGRRYIYGFEVLVLGLGAIASAFAPGIWWLVAFRFILGLGIGGDYPVSATIASEYAGSKVRGLLVGTVFAMQGLGLIVGPLLAIILLSAGVSNDATWRILLGAGALPPLAVFWARRHLRETPRFAQLAQHEAADRVAMRPPHTILEDLRGAYADGTLLRWLVGASFAWFLLDLAYYGNTISTQQFVTAVNPHAGQVQNLLISLGIFALAAFPGYLLAIYGMDRWGRKTIQVLGFAMMAASFGAIAIINTHSMLAAFVALYALNYFFTQFGPNTTTFVYPAEIFPVRIRTTSHGIAATVGKVGAAIGTFTFPLLLARYGLAGPMWVAAVSSVLGLVLTLMLLPEPNGQTLEQASRDRTFELAPGLAHST